MPHYQQIDSDTPQGKRTIKNLIALKAQFQMAGVSAALSQKNLDETLLLATWNIRDFDRPAYGYRSEKSDLTLIIGGSSYSPYSSIDYYKNKTKNK